MAFTELIQLQNHCHCVMHGVLNVMYRFAEMFKNIFITLLYGGLVVL